MRVHLETLNQDVSLAAAELILFAPVLCLPGAERCMAAGNFSEEIWSLYMTRAISSEYPMVICSVITVVKVRF